MQLRFTVAFTTGRAHEVCLQARPGATLDDLLRRLSCLGAPYADGPPVQVEGTAVPLGAQLGFPPLLDRAHLVIGPVRGQPRTCPASGLLTLQVTHGPDTGLTHPLGTGRHTLGRGEHADLRITDESLSRVHAVIEVTGKEVTVHDADSTNGTTLDGAPVGATPVPVRPGQRLGLGTTGVVLATPSELAAATHPDGLGHLLVNRSPRLTPPWRPTTVPLPEPPLDAPAHRLPLLALALPLLVSGLIAAVTHSATMLLFGLMSPLLMLGQWVTDRRGRRLTGRTARRRYAADERRAQEALAEALAEEARARREADPGPAAILTMARTPAARLWERTTSSGPGLTVRVGTGTVPAATRLTRGSADEPPPRLGDLPVLVDLAEPGGVGIAGERERVLAIARAVLGTLAVQRSPRDLRLAVCSSAQDQADWAWVCRLPHALQAQASAGPPPTSSTLDALAHRVGAPPTVTGRPDNREPAVLVLDGAERLRAQPELGAILAGAAAAGIHVLALDASPHQLPGDCHTVLDIRASGALMRHAGAPGCSDLLADAVPPAWAEQVADALAPLRDASCEAGRAGLPERTTLEDLGAGPGDGATLAQRWRHTPRSTRFVLGAGAGGPVVLDLAGDGPHALVGGTTGSGKSELLITLVASLATVNRPDELSFVLVDYKGGAAFGECRDLPHVVGLVTDLDPQLTERALRSLEAELKRRERLLADHGVGDLAAYLDLRARPGSDAPRLARLVIVVDEFRSLAEDLPDFVAGLVRIASLGRSLGVHLVVATQRPGGVVTADMRANIGLRIALRVRDSVDSYDVLDVPDAATLPAGLPGRALVRSASTDLTLVQTARVTASRPVQQGPAVTVTELDGHPLPSPEGALDGPSDLARLVMATHAAASELGATPPRSPWLPPLPVRVRAADLPPVAAGVALGILDDPAAQRQEPFGWDPFTEGTLGIVGGPRTGRTTTLLTVASQLAARYAVADLHLYALHTGGLRVLDGWPHVGAAVDVADLPRVDRLVTVLTTGQPPTAAAVRVLLVDDWDAIAEELMRARHPAVLEALTRLVRGAGTTGEAGRAGRAEPAEPAEPTEPPERFGLTRQGGPDGPAEAGLRRRLGLSVVVAGGRALLTGPVASACTRRLVLLPASQVELVHLGISTRQVPVQPPAGRAIDVTTRQVVQIACPGPVAPRGGPVVSGPVTSGPVRVPAEPASRAAQELFRPAAGERRLAVLGRPGSGRTNAVLVLAAGLHALGHPVALIGDVDLAGPERAGPVFGVEDVDALVALRRAHPDVAVLVDDAERVEGTPIEPVLREILRLVDQDGGVFVAATTLQRAADSARTIGGEAARSGVGLLLGRVEPGEERVLGLRAAVPTAAVAGRALLVRQGQAEHIRLPVAGQA
jgi:S-DNA-T family DNA segregation ATPase FtsK/SpoIIIE